MNYTVVYDGECGVCTRLAARLARLDRSGVFEIVPFQRAGVTARFPWITVAAYDESLQLIRNSDDKTWQGAAAVEQILGELRGGRIIGWIFAIPSVRPLSERLYRWFAQNRARLGCDEHCGVQVTSGTGTKNS